MIRYHHILKTHWLDSKCNQQIDCIIYTLVQNLDPYYLNQHKRQTIGFKGLDLAAVQQKEIKASTRDISPDSVLNFDLAHFHVTSQSHPGKFHVIDLIESTCDCMDFPRIHFCKHIAAIYVHFPHLCPEQNIPSPLPKMLQSPSSLNLQPLTVIPCKS
jgi:hypothetical protein